jgi:hypothetical protein
MKTSTAITKAGSAANLARLLGITQAAVCHWGERLPEQRVWQLMLLKPDWFKRTRLNQPVKV